MIDFTVETEIARSRADVFARCIGARAAGNATMAGAGFEPAKAEPRRLQRLPFDRSGTPPGAMRIAIRGI
jgi:hypothetical protein